MSLKLPADFAKKISESLGMTPLGVDTLFAVEEDKAGFFVAKLKPGQFLEREQFKTMCALARDLGGEGYLQGAKAWAVPGPCAKKSPEKPSEPVKKEPVKVRPPVVTVPVSALLSMPFQSRKQIEDPDLAELVESVKVYGILEPVLVRPKEGGLFEVVAGERRVAAAKKVGVVEVPVIVKFLNDQEAYEVQLVENVQRRDLTDMEKARMLDFMINQFGYTQEALGQKLGKTQGWISQHLAMLQVPDNITRVIKHGELTEHQAREILAAPEEKQQEIVDKINETGEVPSTRELHEIAHPKPPTVNCERCGDPIQPPAIHSKGKFYCTDCAEIIKTEKQEEADAEPIGSGPEPIPEEKETARIPEPAAAPPRVPPAVDVGEFDCPECSKRFHIEHLRNGKHRLVPVWEADEE